MRILIISFFVFICFGGYSQTSKLRDFLNQHQLDIELRGGVIIGGMSPVPIPVEIREIKKYSPEFNGMFEIQVSKWLSDKYGVSSGLRFENKGMETEARVKSYYTQIVNQGDRISGYWTGNVSTTSKISYLTFPVLLNMQLHPRWRVQFGGYLSYNMTGKFLGKVYKGYLRENTPVGQKIEFKDEQYASYDFSDELRQMAYGIQLSSQWKATNNLFALFQFTAGMSDVFKQGFETVSFGMYPFYISVGASYQF